PLGGCPLQWLPVTVRWRLPNSVVVVPSTVAHFGGCPILFGGGYPIQRRLPDSMALLSVVFRSGWVAVTRFGASGPRQEAAKPPPHGGKPLECGSPPPNAPPHGHGVVTHPADEPARWQSRAEILPRWQSRAVLAPNSAQNCHLAGQN